MQAVSTKIYVVRHGQTEANKNDIIQGSSNEPIKNELNETGLNEARMLAQKLNHVAFDYVFSSDLKRARQTCDIITNNREPMTDPRIRERNWKVWEGRPNKEFKEAGSPWDQVEGDEAVRDRAVAFFNEIGKKYSEKTLLVVTHGGLMRNVLIRILGLKCKVDDITAGTTSYYTLKYNGEENWDLGEERDGLGFPENK